MLLQELTRLQKLVQMPPIPEALKGKFSRFDADLNPTHDQDGNELDSKVRLQLAKTLLVHTVHVISLVNVSSSLTAGKRCCEHSKHIATKHVADHIHKDDSVCIGNAVSQHI